MIKIACATNDGVHFIKDHFGSADKYLVYGYDEEKNRFVMESEVKNPHFEEGMDGDPRKANFVSSQLKPLGVNVVMNLALGQNVVSMRKKFAVVVSRVGNIAESLELLNISELKAEIAKPEGEDKKIVYVKKSEV